MTDIDCPDSPWRTSGLLTFAIAWITIIDPLWTSMDLSNFQMFLPPWPEFITVLLWSALYIARRVIGLLCTIYIPWYFNCHYSLRRQYQKLLTKVTCVMYHYKVPKPVREKVLQCYKQAWLEDKIIFPSSKLALYILPRSLREILLGCIKKTILDKVRMYQQCFLLVTSLSSKVQTETYSPGDIVCLQGALADKIYLVGKGVLEAVTFTGERLENMSSGDILGEIGVMHIGGFITRTATVRALIDTELYAISKKDYNDVIDNFPETKRLIANIGKKRLERSHYTARREACG
ncbi:cyclic nucleotide-gated channel rod photoreceptor subunit alpha [Bicyclus anynana]|uniref:Cyclic nucleotide-gated channel rod photoreceptor subunit alpha n=1 Tax=Bicyclus anynana TaxID=110368 RepID=A0A6J1N1I3_BICAN|nr:cyclic nucleotide-gated channel rod photoreceptor subunit alpha [Bicyclus anynana]